MTREEAVAEARHRQASDPDASWIAASRDGGGPHREARTQSPPPSGEPSGAFEGEQSQLALRHLGRAASAVMAFSPDRGMVPAVSG
jgi:hypothetical protein